MLLSYSGEDVEILSFIAPTLHEWDVANKDNLIIIVRLIHLYSEKNNFNALLMKTEWMVFYYATEFWIFFTQCAQTLKIG